MVFRMKVKLICVKKPDERFMIGETFESIELVKLKPNQRYIIFNNRISLNIPLHWIDTYFKRLILHRNDSIDIILKS